MDKKVTNITEELLRIYNEDIEDNDSSFAPFGYAFQADAGLILFMKHFSEIVNISIESKLQDIQMKKENGNLILAQAKSSQVPLKTTSEKSKLHDALFSLIKTNNNETDKLIYVSNLKDPLKSQDYNVFDLREISYNDLSIKAENNVKEQIEKIKVKLESTIANKTESVKIIEKSKKILAHLNSLRYDNLYFLSIPNYFGEDNREKVIVDEVAKFLSEKLDYSPNLSVVMSQKVYTIWHDKVMFNSTLQKDSIKKNIKKDELLWPLVVLFAKNHSLNAIQDIVEFEITDSLDSEVKYISENEFLKLNSFTIVHEILSDYNNYKKNKNPKGITLCFIKDKWKNYRELFDYLQEDEETKIAVTMLFIYEVIENHKNIQKVLKVVL